MLRTVWELFAAEQKEAQLAVGSRVYLRNPYEVGYIFLVPPTGHQVYTLTNMIKEPYIHSPKTVI